MSKRVWIMAGLAAGASMLVGCVVVPEQGYGYGYGRPAAVVRVAPPVVVAPGPVYYHHPRRYYPWWR